MNEWKLTVAPEFGDDLRNIHSYIASQLLEPETAKGLTDKILKSVSELSSFPLIYPIYDKEPWAQRGLRKMSVGNYLVFYLADEGATSVIVMRVFYAGRDIERCLNETL